MAVWSPAINKAGTKKLCFVPIRNGKEKERKEKETIISFSENKTPVEKPGFYIGDKKINLMDKLPVRISLFY